MTNTLKYKYESTSPSINTSVNLNAIHSTEQERQTAIIDNLNRDNIHHYLRGLEVDRETEHIVNHITKGAAEKVGRCLKNGGIQIANNPPPLPVRDPNLQRLSNEELRQMENRARRENLHKKMEYLDEQIRGEGIVESEKEGNLNVNFKQILSKEQHECKIREMAQDKLDRKRRISQLREEQVRRERQQQKNKQAMRVIQQQREKLRKRSKIEDSIQKRKLEHDKFIEEGVKLNKEMMLAKHRSRLYQQMQNKYQSQILIPSLEQKKNKLKQIRDFHSRYDVNTIKLHEKQYLQKSQEKLQRRETKTTQWKYNPPARSNRLSKFLVAEQLQLKQQLEYHHKKLQQMQKRQELYRLQLKEKHRPIVDDDKRRQIEIRLIQQKRKYEKMHPNIDNKKIGEAYLEIAKRMKRVASSGMDNLKTDEKMLRADDAKVVRVSHDQAFYEDIRRRKMENIINSDCASASEKYMMLRMETEKLGEKIKQKQELVRYQHDGSAQNDAAQLILSSIKAQMGIIHILTKNGRQTDDSL